MATQERNPIDGRFKSTGSLWRTPEYRLWGYIKSRCYSPKNKSYRYYGGRGIRVCDEWRNSFEAFLAYIGKKPKGAEFDRIDNNGDYKPGNVRWATRTEQNRNRRTTRFLTANGVTQCVQAWANQLGVSSKAIRQRIANGWTVEDAVSKPSCLQYVRR